MDKCEPAVGRSFGSMTPLQPYLFFPGNAREALTTYQRIFGGELAMFTRAEMQRTDEPLDAIGHSRLAGPVSLHASDADPGQDSLSMSGLMFALLGAAEPATLHGWFDELSEGGKVVEPLQQRPWGAWDGQVIDRFGVHWLIGYET